MSGLLASLTSKLETNWQSSTINHLNSSNDPLEQYIAQQLPPIIQPKSVGLDGPSGSVPVSFAFTWTRYQPRLETFAGEKDEESNGNIYIILIFISIFCMLKPFQKAKGILSEHSTFFKVESRIDIS
ncbi:unnamed protein product [Trichobilharzia regenti]|nr:unnamed protein product [Trichobilharzia regenti]